ncbi:MAG: DUF1553 domain-containing protein [Planctomycetota bacterium]|nr:DUF1553 domain-containing protein [Planctomycetota bacterium]
MTRLLGGLAFGWALAAPPASGEEAVDFARDVRPILSDKCFPCHGPDRRKRKAGLRLDTREGAFKDLGGYRAFEPGDPARSEAYRRITSDDPEERMPFQESNLELSPREIAIVRRWIEQGAAWREHWSLRPIARVAVPEVGDAGWPRSAIDFFVLRRLEELGLRPAAEAGREQLARRVSFDLTGLPPSLSELDAFLADESPDAHEKLVDRLLSSPRLGERLAADWLDVARYADTYGYQSDVYRAMWPWRDWVVRAFNEGLPYDRFVTWQLAGDLLPAPTRDQVLATAFNRHHRQTNEGGSIEAEFRVEYVADRTNTFGAAFLGLTLECARCHDHKFDPVSQKEYYQLFSFFNNIDESGLYSHFTNAVPTPTLLLFSEGERRRLDAAERRVADEEAALRSVAASRREAFRDWLEASPRQASLADLVGDYPFEAIEGGKVENRADPKTPGRASDGPRLVPGKVGRGLELSGENNVTLPVGGNFTRNDAFSVALWLWTPEPKERAVVFHRSRAWTDAGSRGYQLLIEDGRLSASLIHFWPGNAIRVRTKDALAVGEWVHVAVTYDGSSRSGGLRIHVDGELAACETVRDNLYKSITGGGADSLILGQRFRDRGFKGGRVDELRIFRRELCAVEVAQLHDGTTLDGLLARSGGKLDPGEEAALFEHYLRSHDGPYRERLAALRELRQERSRAIDSVAEIMVMEEMPEPRATYVLRRGAYDAPTVRVESTTPASLPPFPGQLPRNRLGLARWLTHGEHPLLARVTVNRHWNALFGRGLVTTPEDFGSQGQPPSHPALLDWLAGEFVRSGWDVKALLRRIVTSATYRQSSRISPELRARDPDNVLLFRGPRNRLPAEMVRDGALFASGLLVEKLGGPPVKPFQPAGLWKEKSGKVYKRDVGEGSHRRSLYTYWKRTSPPPQMMTLDAAKRDVCVVERHVTATPLQALLLLNDPQYVEAARVLAERVLREAGPGLDERITHAFRTLTSRRPTADEVTVLERLYREQREEFRARPGAAEKFLAVGDAKRDEELSPLDVAALAVMVNALMNHDATVMKR